MFTYKTCAFAISVVACRISQMWLLVLVIWILARIDVFAVGGFAVDSSLANPSITSDVEQPQPNIFVGKLKSYQLKVRRTCAWFFSQLSLLLEMMQGIKNLVHVMWWVLGAELLYNWGNQNMLTDLPVKKISDPLLEVWVALPEYGSCKSSATHLYQHVQPFCVSTQ